MAQPPYYSPRLDRDLISQLYHAARGRKEPMTRLASALIREGLARLAGSDDDESAVLRETPPVATLPQEMEGLQCGDGS